MSDVPLGAFLSGGVDSSGIVAMMAGLKSDPVRTFAIGFGGDDDELVYAQAMADRYGTRHTAERETVSYLDAIDGQAEIFGEPFADSSAVPTGRVSQLARRAVTVALSGDAGDELFAGYRRLSIPSRGRARARNDALSAAPSRCSGCWGRSIRKLDRWSALDARQDQLSGIGRRRSARLLPHGLQDSRCDAGEPVRRGNRFRYRPASAGGADPGGDGPRRDTQGRWRGAQFADIETYLVGDILTKVDRTSMAHSLESYAAPAAGSTNWSNGRRRSCRPISKSVGPAANTF